MIPEEILEKYPQIFEPNIQFNNMKISPLGSGHIHQTYLIENVVEGITGGFVFQRINSHVFPNSELLMKNIMQVTEYLKSIYVDDSQVTLHFLKNAAEQYFSLDKEGFAWRVSMFIESSQTLDVVSNLEEAFQCGKAIGTFHHDLQGLHVDSIKETIPNFHHIESRLEKLDEVTKHAQDHLKKEVNSCLEFVNNRRNKMSNILNLGRQGLLPLRVIHNDTKCNNILFNKDGKSWGMIDLDTVMPGYVAYDFGDAVRTLIFSLKEDEPDLSNAEIYLDKLEAFTNGYLSEAKGFLLETERKSLMDGVLLLPYMQGVRFLTDYLDGNKYFKTNYQKHNLDRALNQFKMVELLEEKWGEISKLVE